MSYAHSHAHSYDRAVAGVFEARERDWRCGAVVYQVLVDRFAPSARLDSKRDLYPAPKRLRTWDETPKGGTYLAEHKVWSHEIDFWGGDLASVAAKLDYVQSLGADVLYLNPIHLGWTNHKYDSLDYQAVSPEFGTREEVIALADAVHARGMKIVLDGVFNHMGRNAAIFQSAFSDPTSPYRDWFVIDDSLPSGARCWWNAQNLPELNLENPQVRDHIYAAPDSVVRRYLREGIDGWRLDVAFDIGFNYLQALTEAAHAERPGSLVVGEIPNFPREWFPSVDGVMQFAMLRLMIALANGAIDAGTFSRMIGRIVAEADYEHLLKSWTYLDNHDTKRVATAIPNAAARRQAQLLQFTLPGSPTVYYGSEVGMEGGDDPEMRAPMRWDRVAEAHADLAWTKQLIALRKNHRALRVGNLRMLESTPGVVAFERHTDRIQDSVLVIANPGETELNAQVLMSNSKFMDGQNLRDLLAASDAEAQYGVYGCMVLVKLAPRQTLLLAPQITTPGGYSNFKRVQ